MSPSEVASYYRAALRALRFVEHRRPTGRRFGTEADARWAAFRGDLEIADRIDLLIRDADAEWPRAFGARAVFRFDEVAEDDPFGRSWEPMDTVDAEELWRATLAEPAPTTLGAAIDGVTSAWGIARAPVSLGALGSSDRFVVAGPSAIASLVAAFAESGDLEWQRQAIVVATPPAARQLAALAPAWLNDNRSFARIVAADEAASGLGAHRAIVSDDATADDRRWATELSKGT